MNRYNIYAGEKGKVKYLYTTQSENILAAGQTARDEMCLDYALTNGTKTYGEAEEIIRDRYRNDNITEEDLKHKIYELFDEWRDDDIAEDDLILDYDNSSN